MFAKVLASLAVFTVGATAAAVLPRIACGPQRGYISVPNPLSPGSTVYLDNGAGLYAPNGIVQASIGAQSTPAIFTFNSCLDSFEIYCTNCAQDYPYLGFTWLAATNSNNGFTMGDRLLGEALLSRVPHVPAGQQQNVPSAFSPDGSSPSVSAVWSWNADHKTFIPHWVNPDGSSVTTFQFQGTMQWYSNVWYLPVVMSADWTDKGTATRAPLTFVSA